MTTVSADICRLFGVPESIGTVTYEPETPWQLTEDARYWRVVEEAEDRKHAALYGQPSHPFRWHSVSCACEGCLDTDAVLYAYDDTELVDMTGIQP